jgi:hypothetical protein
MKPMVPNYHILPHEKVKRKGFYKSIDIRSKNPAT